MELKKTVQFTSIISLLQSDENAPLGNIMVVIFISLKQRSHKSDIIKNQDDF